MKRFGSIILALILALTLFVPMLSVSAEGEVIDITLSCDGSAYAGGEIVLKVSVSKPTQALAGLEFTLLYDSSALTPQITTNTEDGREMDALVSEMPQGWEQLSYHSEGSYQFRFAMPDSGSAYLDKEGEICLMIPFDVKKAGEFKFTVSDADVIAISADKLLPLSGNGCELTMVAASEAQKLAVNVVSGEIAYENSLYYLKIDALNLGDDNGIIGLEFDVYYDKASFKPTITENASGQMDSFMKTMPKNAWEQMCSLDESKGCYTIRLAALHAESTTDCEALESGKKLSLAIPFRVLASEGSVAEFRIDSNSILALNGKNKIASGSGNKLTVSVEKATASMLPEELGYEIKDGLLLNVPAETDINEFLAPLSTFSITDKNGTLETEGNVCPEYILTDGVNSYTIVVRGDGDGTGTIDTYDYVLARRAYFGTYIPNEACLSALALSDGIAVTTYDYILIRRHFFGTVDLNKV